ncbi:hypothetical protein ACFOUP_03405 [Belliella kenyensis]|uniref:Uncharacterized protein n=1 Tax=Belliella kenyensis TaxID=1472724 RepID=A0ABV8EJL0_9BACT|nr:hypothetical protein [Belliella kenyensis]MCH7402343.1 hypothetical protein [Belliella kenyensis]MDN3603535.1 hypothetical protein [Belliella kenyensis]
MRYTTIITLLFSIIFTFSCETKREKKEEVKIPKSQTDSVETDSPEISFYFYEEKNDYPDAILEMFSPLGNQVFKPGKVPFEFNIKNYPFGDGLNNFQLKLILNSSDPVGYNMPIFQRELNEGTYRAIAYLVDEEGLALKEFGNYVDRDFRVGDTRPFPFSSEPYIAINLPNDGQTYNLGDEVTIDFLLLGGDLKQDKLKVIISIDGFQYDVNEVTPVRISDLPKGEHAISVKLVKKDGQELDGPFSSVRKRVMIQ